jgi:hypothetical protein
MIDSYNNDKNMKLTFLNKMGLYDAKPDEDGLFEGMCVPRPQANYILYLSGLSFVSAFYGFYRGHYFFACLPLTVACTTILYWINPIDCWRRYIDMFVAIGGMTVQLLFAINAEYAIPYYLFKISAMICYPIGHYFHNLGHIWLGTLWHSGIHILGNIANVILYSGYIL